ncbi:hypothetical protein [Kitasatospora sp. NPDC127116]|uniref:hypothetical protein n=1 Tax=Kitasatospora sp. NPDC127116 TaxID=3345367 RepID=UPI0036419D23
MLTTGDTVIVTRPAQPTAHQVGDRLTVISVSADQRLVKTHDDQGVEATVWAHEITPE